MKTTVNPTQECAAIAPVALRGSLIDFAFTAVLVLAMPLSAARADDEPPSSSRLQPATESAAVREVSEVPQGGALDASGKPVCAELGQIAQGPAPATGIDGEFTGAVGCGVYKIYSDAAPDLDVATGDVWNHIEVWHQLQ